METDTYSPEIAYVVTTYVALDNMGIFDSADSAPRDDTHKARVEKYLSTSDRSENIEHHIKEMIKDALPANDSVAKARLTPLAMHALSNKIATYFESLGFHADGKSLYTCMMTIDRFDTRSL
jgi:hypothetical protein